MGQRGKAAAWAWLLLAAACFCGPAAGRALQRPGPEVAAPGPCTPTQVSGAASGHACSSNLQVAPRAEQRAGSSPRRTPRASQPQFCCWPASGATAGVTARRRRCRRRRCLPAGAHCADGQPYGDAGGLEDARRQVRSQQARSSCALHTAAPAAVRLAPPRAAPPTRLPPPACPAVQLPELRHLRPSGGAGSEPS